MPLVRSIIREAGKKDNKLSAYVLGVETVTRIWEQAHGRR